MSWDCHHFHTLVINRENMQLHTCMQLPAPSCCYPGSFWEALSLTVWGRSQEAGTPPNVHSDLGSSRQWSGPGPFCHIDTGWGEESAPADREPCPACSLTQVTQVTKLDCEITSDQSVIPRGRWHLTLMLKRFSQQSNNEVCEFFYQTDILPSAIAPRTRIPDSLTTQSGWKSRPFKRGRRWGKRSSRKTLAKTSRAAAEHFPIKKEKKKTRMRNVFKSSFTSLTMRQHLGGALDDLGGIDLDHPAFRSTYAGSSRTVCHRRRRHRRRLCPRPPHPLPLRAVRWPYATCGSEAWCPDRCLEQLRLLLHHPGNISTRVN